MKDIEIVRGLSAAVMKPKAITPALQGKINNYLVEHLGRIEFFGIEKNEVAPIESSKKTGMSIAFSSDSITKEDSEHIVEVLKYTIMDFDLKPIINWDKGKGVYVFNLFVK